LKDIWRKSGEHGFKSSDLYLTATGIAEKSDKVQFVTFFHMVGDDAIKVFNTMDFDGHVDDFEVL